MTSVKVVVRKTKGGPGSGNWGHSGIQGMQGGSAPRSGGRFGGGSSKVQKTVPFEKRVYDSVDAIRSNYGKPEVDGIIKKARTAIAMDGLPSGVKIWEAKTTDPGKLHYMDTDSWLHGKMSEKSDIVEIMTVYSTRIENTARKVIQ